MSGRNPQNHKRNRTEMGTRELLSVEGLTKHFHMRHPLTNRITATVQAVDDVSFSVSEGEVLGVVGESGCGKSTTARLLMQLMWPDRGTVCIGGAPIKTHRAGLKALRRQIQMVFQDSYSSLNPRMQVKESIAFGPRALGISRQEANERTTQLLEMVGLAPALFAQRYPHELSGGQRQRVNIARALALRPKLVILDEAVSSLDKSVQAQILNLLGELKTSLGLTYIFISHDLSVIEFISDRILVMYLGKVVETGTVEEIYSDPRHPYTRVLLASRLNIDPRRRTTEAPISGDPPSPINPPSGCRFRTRCKYAEAVCASTAPVSIQVGGSLTHEVACLIEQPGSGHSMARS